MVWLPTSGHPCYSAPMTARAVSIFSMSKVPAPTIGASTGKRAALPPFLLLVTLLLTTAALAADIDDRTLTSVFSQYENLKPTVTALVGDIREARKEGRSVEQGKVLLVRKQIGDFVKALRRYDKDHLRAAKGAKTYPDREKVVRLFHITDAIHRWIDAETKAADFQLLGLKYEDMWKQADGALAGDRTMDR